ncbi:MAG: hypothetical protein C5B59_17445 [Bacteroidetes bacterium]|nr:MAG: hypothetical protein C5B59_17445 [Bacteroidota bacterium]
MPDQAWKDRLIRLLGMLGSSFDGERANAGKMANDMLKKAGLTWEDVISVNVKQKQKEYAHAKYPWEEGFYQSGNYYRNPDPNPEEEISDLQMADICDTYQQYLSEWEKGFLKSIIDRLDAELPLTMRQHRTLVNIYKKVKQYA